jgi:RNA polymerase sigma-70 factor (ECF subfamily)
LEGLEREEAATLVRDAIRTLPPAYREVIVLCELQEMDYADAAAVLECPIGTVRSRLHRGRALLTQKLASRRETISVE